MPRSLAALALVSLTSCGSLLSFTESRLLSIGERRWETRGFADYSVEMQRGCFCDPELSGWARVDVRGGTVQRVTLLATGTVITDSRKDFWATVEELYDRIREAGADDGLADVEFELDPILGYPVLVRWHSRPDVLDGGGVDRLRNALPLP